MQRECVQPLGSSASFAEISGHGMRCVIHSQRDLRQAFCRFEQTTRVGETLRLRRAIGRSCLNDDSGAARLLGVSEAFIESRKSTLRASLARKTSELDVDTARLAGPPICHKASGVPLSHPTGRSHVREFICGIVQVIVLTNADSANSCNSFESDFFPLIALDNF